MSTARRRPSARLAAIAMIAFSMASISPLTAATSSAAALDVVVNEIESNPDDWVELYNNSSGPVSLAGYIVKDDDDTHSYVLPAGASIPAGGHYVAEPLGFGLGGADEVRLFAPDGVTVLDSYAWTAHAPTTYGRCPDGTGAFKTNTTSTKGTANDCSVSIKINEVESGGDPPGDWVELYNPGPAPADLTGFVFKDDDDTRGYSLPAGTTVAVGGYLVLDEGADLGFDFDSADSARLFRPDGTLADSYSWTTGATTTYGRCPNGTGDFTTTFSPTKGGPNTCGAPVTTVHINEIETSGGVPGDWIELHNTGPERVDISGWTVRDNDDTHTLVLPAGSTIAGGGYLIVEEAALDFGLGGADSVRPTTRAGTCSSPIPGRRLRPPPTGAARTGPANSRPPRA